MNDRETLDLQLNVLARLRTGAARGVPPLQVSLFLANGSTVPMQIEDARTVQRSVAGRGRYDGSLDSHRSPPKACGSRTETNRRLGPERQRSEAAYRRRQSRSRRPRGLREMGPRFVVIKKGEHGAMFFSKHETYVLAGLPHSQTSSIRPARAIASPEWNDGLSGRARQLRAEDAQGSDGLRNA